MHTVSIKKWCSLNNHIYKIIRGNAPLESQQTSSVSQIFLNKMQTLQAFHICSSDSEGTFTKYSFLCPNGTIFNQEWGQTIQ
jgi:hypothetical protein